MVASGCADFAISEDSDLIAYGCPNILMKLTPHGSCLQFKFENFYEFKTESKEIQTLQSLTKREFILACVMAGCEYLPNIERVGLKVALKHFNREKTFVKVIEYLKKQKTYLDRIPDTYIPEANKVADLFQYQTVYNPELKKLA